MKQNKIKVYDTIEELVSNIISPECDNRKKTIKCYNWRQEVANKSN